MERKRKAKMADLEFDKALNKTHQSGISAGLERASRMLMDRATRAFKQGNDTLAKDLRQISVELNEDAVLQNPLTMEEASQ